MSILAQGLAVRRGARLGTAARLGPEDRKSLEDGACVAGGDERTAGEDEGVREEGAAATRGLAKGKQDVQAVDPTRTAERGSPITAAEQQDRGLPKATKLQRPGGQSAGEGRL
ncbi:uncharacterized protein PV09_02315 [Verruconis gallopava]|uniref:Uncharacterized protein n=1 Tax=Verruconis gallopava TaxID=253628 RepID=A0A0D2AJ78_9PEZI|nr:uncharacterized protein PV09_02315 [Verruconis gallopava]KIW06600.1 hypothetical protein PV09_02315 [Verruconis gallopava]